jgi:exosortase/archaeosortase family protein
VATDKGALARISWPDGRRRGSARLEWIERLPVWVWSALPVLALLPVWRWCMARLRDGSDDPLGIVALVALAVLVTRSRRRFAQTPRSGWLCLATLLGVGAVLALWLPPLARGVLAVLCVVSVLMSMRTPGQPMLALTGLALLALPLLSSLQFFLGFPLRLITAEASRWLLVLGGATVERSGSALEVAGQLVIVDAPCSGIQMGWVAYFTACLAAGWREIPDGHFLRRVPLVGATVLLGNIARNTVLVIKEAGLVQMPDSMHQIIGLAAFAGVVGMVLWVIGTAGGQAVAHSSIYRRRRFAKVTPRSRWIRLLSGLVFVGLALAPLFEPERAIASSIKPSVEWPHELEGRPLQPLALSAVERRFADRFPGAIGRFTDGTRIIVLRQVMQPSRMLHPASDCYRSLGYRIESIALEKKVGDDSQLQRCFIAVRGTHEIRVCEHIRDASGNTFTDTSAWYWSAVMGKSSGPWLAMTEAKPWR